jgi:glycosyltransferase involved in cell wall biosynthesis
MQSEILDGHSTSPAQQTSRGLWHIVTSEFPPQAGGVSDYTQQLAAGLAAQGDEVHVWCPACPNPQPEIGGVTVHRDLGGFSPSDLRRVDQELDRLPGPRRILVQWVPHGYGYRSMNLAFCWWLRKRATQYGDSVELMVHEPFLTFGWRSLRQNAAAFVHRIMTIVLLGAASRVWISIPHWEALLSPYSLGRRKHFRWLPIPSNIPVVGDPAAAQAIRRQYVNGQRLLVGHFGTYGTLVTTLLEPIVRALAEADPTCVLLLMGRGSEQFRQRLIEAAPQLDAVIQATGPLAPEALSDHLAACDMLIQPYPDGVSSRRTSFMAGLAHGKPIITSTGSLTESLWAHSDAVALAPAGDLEAFVAAFRRLRLDTNARLRAAAAARELYRERFDMAHTIRALRQAGVGESRACAS